MNKDGGKVVDTIFNKIDKEGISGLKKYCIFIISVILFISPITIFSMTYGRELFMRYSQYEKVILNIVINTLVFVFLYYIGARVRHVEIEEKRTALNIIVTLFIMGGSSSLMVISYAIYQIVIGSMEVKIGIILFLVFVIISFIYFSFCKGNEKESKEQNNNSIKKMKKLD